MFSEAIQVRLNNPFIKENVPMEPEPIWDIAHLAHVELLTPKLDESIRFFTDIMGMSVTAEQGDSAYLRAYDDYEHHTLKLTAAGLPGMGHYAWRARSPQALQRRVAAIEATGLGKGWTDGDLGHGPAYTLRSRIKHLAFLGEVLICAALTTSTRLQLT
jgi:catechol 2,3-dioxygenase